MKISRSNPFHFCCFIRKRMPVGLVPIILCLTLLGSVGSAAQANNPSFAISVVPVSYVTESHYPTTVCAIDFNSDGYLDIILPLSFFPQSYPERYSRPIALKNIGSGLFVDSSPDVLEDTWVIGVGTGRIKAGDFNGDGRTDLFLGDGGVDTSPFLGGQNRLLIQFPDKFLRDETSNRLPIFNTFIDSAAVGDIDSDGDLDIFVANAFFPPPGIGSRLFVNDGRGSFSPNLRSLPEDIIMSFGFPPIHKQCVAALFGDIERDGDLDLVLGIAGEGRWDRNAILLNDGRGEFNFAPKSAMPLRIGGSSGCTDIIASDDFDGDGFVDLVMASAPCGGGNPPIGAIQLFLNNGNGTFRDASSHLPVPPIPSASSYSSLIPVEINGDEHVDLIVVRNGSPMLVFLNQGTATFVEAASALSPLSANAVATGDFDGDGRIDLFITSFERTCYLALNRAGNPRTGFDPNKSNQAIIFPSIQDRMVGDPPFTVEAKANSGLPVSFSVVSGPVMIAGNTIVLTGSGKAIIRASQAGSDRYNPAAPSDQSFTIADATPIIRQQPQTVSAFALGKAEFRAKATGAPPLVYQWRFNGQDLAAATNSTLVIQNIQLTDSGDYSVVVRNSQGLATSLNAPLRVLSSSLLNRFDSLTELELWRRDGGRASGSVYLDSSTDGEQDDDSSSMKFMIEFSSQFQADNSARYVRDFATPLDPALFDELQMDVLIDPRSAGGSARHPPFAVYARTGSDLSGRLLFAAELPKNLGWFRVRAPLDQLDASMRAISWNMDAPPNFDGPVTLWIDNLRLIRKRTGPPVVADSFQTQTLNFGASATLSVDASGLGPMSFQWRRDGRDLGNATDATLLIPSAGLSDAGTYSVVVSNPAGSITNSVGFLAIDISDTVFQDTFDVSIQGAQVNFENGGGRQNGSSAGVLSYSSGGSPGESVRLNSAEAPGRVGFSIQRYAWISPEHNFTEGSNFRIEFDVQPSTAPGDSWGGVVFGTRQGASMNDPDGVGILFRGSGGYSIFVAGANTDHGSVSMPSRVRIEVAGQSFSGTDSTTTRFFVNDALVGTQTKVDGFKANFVTLIGHNGTGRPLVHSFDNLRISAERDIGIAPANVTVAMDQPPPSIRVQIPNALNRIVPATITVKSLNPSIAFPEGAVDGARALLFAAGDSSGQNFQVRALAPGETTFVITNAYGVKVAGDLHVSVTAPAIAPSILLQPLNTTVTSGTEAVFNLNATGTQPLTYQWQFNGVNMPGATNTVLTIPAAQPSNTGSYRAVVSNAAGSVTTDSATLTVMPIPNPPTITTPPQSRSAVAGEIVTFIGSAIGSLPLAYQWQFNGTNIPEAVQSTLTLTNVQPPQAGSYTLLVTNSTGSSASSIATLIVQPSYAEFNFTQGSAPGWQATHDISALRTTSDGMVIQISGNDPYSWGPARNYPAGVPLWLEVRIKSDQSGQGQFFYFTSSPSEANSIRFNVPGGVWFETRLALPPLGSSYRLRFDPPGVGGSCTVAYLRITRRDLDAAKAIPSINWLNPPPIDYGAALSRAQLNASADVSGTFDYSPSPGAVLNAGTQTLAATFSPDNLASHRVVTAKTALVVNKITPKIAWPPPAPIRYGSVLDSPQLNASANVPGSFVYSPAAGTQLESGNDLKINAVFTPDDLLNYNPAAASITITVLKADQFISFASIADRTLAHSTVALSAMSSADLPVTFNLVSGPAVLTNNQLTLTNTGTVTVRATQPGDANHLPSPVVEQTFRVTKAPQSIAFEPIRDQIYGAPPLALNASASSGLPVAFSIVSGPASLLENLITLNASGTVVVRASQPGDFIYDPAPDLNQMFIIAKADQTISFAPVGKRNLGDPPFEIRAYASSHLPVSVTVVSGPAEISGNVLTVTDIGTVLLRASQSGDGNYNAAPTVDHSFTVIGGAVELRISSLTISPKGELELSCTGTTGRTFILERSSDLTVWIVVDTRTNLTGNFQFKDSVATGRTQSFYRVALKP